MQISFSSSKSDIRIPVLIQFDLSYLGFPHDLGASKAHVMNNLNNYA